MPRRRRIIVAGEVHHCMSRGLDGCDIFADDTDRHRFLSVLGKNLTACGCQCYAWALVPNHYHLVVRPLGERLDKMMRRINGAYARWFNKRHNRRGYLFQDRYRSIATQDQRYLRELIRYVHLNPLRAGLVRTLEELYRYPWSGHRAVMGGAQIPWQSVEQVLSRFGRTRSRARADYLRFLGEAVEPGGDAEADAGADFAGRIMALPNLTSESDDDRVAGDAEFVRRVVAAAEQDLRHSRAKTKNRPPLEDTAAACAARHGLVPSAILIRGRRDARSRARGEFCHSAHNELGYRIREIAAYLGVNPSCVARAIDAIGARPPLAVAPD